MTTQLLFRDDAYLREAKTQVLGHTPEGGIVVQASIFYATGGGQPGDSGFIYWEGRKLEIATAVRIEGGLIALVPAEAAALPREGVEVVQQIDWTRRHKTDANAHRAASFVCGDPAAGHRRPDRRRAGSARFHDARAARGCGSA